MSSNKLSIGEKVILAGFIRTPQEDYVDEVDGECYRFKCFIRTPKRDGAYIEIKKNIGLEQIVKLLDLRIGTSVYIKKYDIENDIYTITTTKQGDLNKSIAERLVDDVYSSSENDALKFLNNMSLGVIQELIKSIDERYLPALLYRVRREDNNLSGRWFSCFREIVKRIDKKYLRNMWNESGLKWGRDIIAPRLVAEDPDDLELMKAISSDDNIDLKTRILAAEKAGIKLTEIMGPIEDKDLIKELALAAKDAIEKKAETITFYMGGEKIEINPEKKHEKIYSSQQLNETKSDKCECGGEKAGTTHAEWCPKFI